jgi:hypothetical protein
MARVYGSEEPRLYYARQVLSGQSYNCRIRVFSGGCWSCEGKSAPGVITVQSRTGRPAFSAQRKTCSRQSSMLTFARLLQQISTPFCAVASNGGFEQALVVTQQVDGAKGALGPGGRVEQHQVVFDVAPGAGKLGSLCPRRWVIGKPGQLADRREVVGLHKRHGWATLRVQLARSRDRRPGCPRRSPGCRPRGRRRRLH